MISVKSKIIKKQNLIESNFQDCIMLYDSANGKYYVLNEIGSIIWGLLEEKNSIEISEILHRIMLIYPQEVCCVETDVIKFVENMVLKGIALIGG